MTVENEALRHLLSTKANQIEYLCDELEQAKKELAEVKSASEILISGCSDCPAREASCGPCPICKSDSDWCSLSEDAYDLGRVDPPDGWSPDWCPLKNGDIVLRLKKE